LQDPLELFGVPLLIVKTGRDIRPGQPAPMLPLDHYGRGLGCECFTYTSAAVEEHERGCVHWLHSLLPEGLKTFGKVSFFCYYCRKPCVIIQNSSVMIPCVSRDSLCTSVHISTINVSTFFELLSTRSRARRHRVGRCRAPPEFPKFGKVCERPTRQ